MEATVFKLIQLALVFGGAIGFAVWQIVSVNKELANAKGKSMFQGD